jgi:hypothetical protein
MMLEFERGSTRPLSGELVSEVAVDLSRDRISSEWHVFLQQKLWICPAYLFVFLLSSGTDFYMKYINISDND